MCPPPPLHCTVNIFVSKSGHLSNSNNCKIFLHFLQKFCSIWWFFKVENSQNIIKYSKNLHKNEENLTIFTIIFKNGCFWNQKCSQCIGPYDIITKHQNSISNYWLPVIENTCYKIQNLSHIFTFTYYHFQKKKNINIWFSSFYRCSLPILTNPNPF